MHIIYYDFLSEAGRTRKKLCNFLNSTKILCNFAKCYKYYVTRRFLSEGLLALNMSNEAGEKKQQERKQSLVNALIIVKMIGPNMRRTQPESSWSTDLQDDPDVEAVVIAHISEDVNMNCEVY